MKCGPRDCQEEANSGMIDIALSMEIRRDQSERHFRRERKGGTILFLELLGFGHPLSFRTDLPDLLAVDRSFGHELPAPAMRRWFRASAVCTEDAGSLRPVPSSQASSRPQPCLTLKPVKRIWPTRVRGDHPRMARSAKAL